MDQLEIIAITGGPCAGKSSALSYLAEKLPERGWRVLIMDETATKVITNGLSDIGKIAQSDPGLYLKIEKRMLEMQRDLRNHYIDLAGDLGGKVILLEDRGLMDFQAYLGEEEFMKILKEMNMPLEEARDSYAGVIHLVSAANGAEKAYTLSNNAARRETLEEARALDEVTMKCWYGHPHLRVITNGGNFEWKLKETLNAVLEAVGDPIRVEKERKFLLKTIPDFVNSPLKDAVRIDITQTYLYSEEEEIRVRKRESKNQATYFLTRKKGRGKERIENERIISLKEYTTLLELRDTSRTPVSKQRWCMAWEGQYLEIDVYPQGGAILEIEGKDEVILPYFLNIEREVTGEKDYSNAMIALQGWPAEIQV